MNRAGWIKREDSAIYLADLTRNALNDREI